MYLITNICGQHYYCIVKFVSIMWSSLSALCGKVCQQLCGQVCQYMYLDGQVCQYLDGQIVNILQQIWKLSLSITYTLYTISSTNKLFSINIQQMSSHFQLLNLRLPDNFCVLYELKMSKTLLLLLW